MNTDKELDEIMTKFRGSQIEPSSLEDWNNAKQAIQALIHRHQNQLLGKLLEEAIIVGMEADEEDRWEIKRAVPVEAINKLRSK